MAISDDRLKFDTITSLTQVDFKTKKDVSSANTTAATGAADTSSSASGASGKAKSTLSKIAENKNKEDLVIPEADVQIGNFGEEGDCLNFSLPKLQRFNLGTKFNFRDLKLSGLKFNGLGFKLPTYNIGDFGDLGLSLPEVPSLGCNVNTSAMDSMLKSIKEVKEKYDVLKVENEARVDALIDRLAKSKLGTNGLNKYLSKDKLNDTIKKDLTAKVGIGGTTIKAKVNMETLLSSCSAKVSAEGLVDIESAISVAVVSGILKNMDCLGPEYIIDFIQNVVGIDPENKNLILKSIIDTSLKDADASVEKKIMILQAIKSVDDNDRDQIHTRGASKVLIDNVGKSENTSNSSMSDYINLTTSLDNIDPTWKLDSEGNEDYSVTADNKRMKDLSNSYILNTADDTYTHNGEVTTGLTEAQKIAVINAF